MSRTECDEGWPRQCPRMKDFGSGKEVRRMKSKVKTDKQDEYECIDDKT
jgi:hypothetical protein